MIYEAMAANAKEFTHSFHGLGEGFSERLFLSLFILTLQPETFVLIECCLWLIFVFFPPPSHFMQQLFSSGISKKNLHLTLHAHHPQRL